MSSNLIFVWLRDHSAEGEYHCRSGPLCDVMHLPLFFPICLAISGSCFAILFHVFCSDSSTFGNNLKASIRTNSDGNHFG